MKNSGFEWTDYTPCMDHQVRHTMNLPTQVTMYSTALDVNGINVKYASCILCMYLFTEINVIKMIQKINEIVVLSMFR